MTSKSIDIKKLMESISAGDLPHKINNGRYDSILEELTTKLYKNPIGLKKYKIEIAEKYSISEEDIEMKFLEVYGVSADEYTDIIAESKSEIEEQTGALKGATQAALDKFIAKYGIGGAKFGAQGRTEIRNQAQDLYNKWRKASAMADAQATMKNLKTFLLGLKTNPTAVNKAMAEFDKYLNKPVGPDQEPSDDDKAQALYNSLYEAEEVLTGTNLKNFFQRVKQLEFQALQQLAAKQAQELAKKTQAIKQKTQQTQQKAAKSAKPDTAQLQQQIKDLPPATRNELLVNLIKQYSGA